MTEKAETFHSHDHVINTTRVYEVPVRPLLFWSVAGALVGIIAWLSWDIYRSNRTVREAERVTEIASTVVQAVNDANQEEASADE